MSDDNAPEPQNLDEARRLLAEVRAERDHAVMCRERATFTAQRRKKQLDKLKAQLQEAQAKPKPETQQPKPEPLGFQL